MKFAAGGRSAFTLGFLAVLAAGLAIAYANSLGIGFYFDDGLGIVDNPAIRSLWNVPRFFVDPFTVTPIRENVDIRPLIVTSFALNHAISGVDPWSYHVFNLIVHFLTSLMVFVLVRDHVWWPASQRGPQGAARWPAASAALFFAFAPINNQPVNYIWARSALLCTAFYLAAFLATLRRRMLAAVALHALALLSKAIALSLPGVVVAYGFLYRDRTRHPDLRSWLRDGKQVLLPALPLVVVDLVYLVYRSQVLPPWSYKAMKEIGVTPRIWFISQWPALVHYVRVFVWPTGLSIDHDFPYTTAFTEPRAWGSALALVAWLAAGIGVARRLPHVAFATLWFFITLAPEHTFVPMTEVINDHRPYIASSLGLSVLLAWGVERASSLAGRRQREAFAALSLLICVGAVAVGNRRTADWESAETLWESTIVTSPNNGRAWLNAAAVQLKKGDLVKARRRFERARQLVPNYPYLYISLSNLALTEGNLEEAVAQARIAVRLGPTLARSRYQLGYTLEHSGKLDQAIKAYRRATELDPNDQRSREALERAELAKTKN